MQLVCRAAAVKMAEEKYAYSYTPAPVQVLAAAAAKWQKLKGYSSKKDRPRSPTAQGYKTPYDLTDGISDKIPSDFDSVASDFSHLNLKQLEGEDSPTAYRNEVMSIEELEKKHKEMRSKGSAGKKMTTFAKTVARSAALPFMAWGRASNKAYHKIQHKNKKDKERRNGAGEGERLINEERIIYSPYPTKKRGPFRRRKQNKKNSKAKRVDERFTKFANERFQESATWAEQSPSQKKNRRGRRV